LVLNFFMKPSIADIRKEYSTQNLLEKDVAHDPISQFAQWWDQVIESKIDEANAMTLATSSSDGVPSARIVLLKSFDERGFVFYTNYKSFKGMQLDENPKACLVFFWKELERQVRIVGLVSRVSDEENDQYFGSRPVGSRIGAWTSPQSQVIPDRSWLDNEYLKIAEQLNNKEIKRPEHWGGYLVKPVVIEFWQGRPSRLHDRIQYSLEENGSWKIERLAP
jgi:pyridoxamine 5'-phosphate oxidase